MKARLIGIALWVVAGLMLGLAVHLASILLLPRLAPADARARLAGVAAVNSLTTLEGAGRALPLTDPAFETAVCRFDLSAGILHVRAPVTPHYTALAVYTAEGLALGAVNDKAAIRRTLDLFVVTAAQRRELTLGDDDTLADNLIIVSPTAEGFVLVRALAAQPSLGPLIRQQLESQALCEILTPEQVPATQ